MDKMRLYFARHGMTEWNDDGKMQGRTDVPLNEAGILQARLLAKKLANLPLKAIYTSPLSRAMKTAEIIARPHNLEVIPVPSLQEADFGKWEGLTIEEIKSGWGDELELWYEGKSLPPEGEGILEMQRRVVEFIEELKEKHKGEEILLVAHGGPIRAFVCHILGTLKPFRRIKQANANINIFDYFEEWGWQIVALNDTCHLAEELHSDMEDGY
ncbi:histidine phosphatase family protein [bacterium]|nr:histidine phosphatase family protein [bacterium]